MTGTAFLGKPPGGGGCAAFAYHPTIPAISVIGTDTAPPVFSTQHTSSGIAMWLGLRTTSEKHFDAFEFQADGTKTWGLCGSGNGTDGGLAYYDHVDGNDPSGAVFIGPTPGTAGHPNFNGSNGVGTAAPSTSNYPRHYSNHFVIDETTRSGKYVFYLGTVDDGIYRWVVDKTTLAVEEQSTIAPGKYISWFAFPTFKGVVTDYSRLLIGPYNKGGSEPVLLCTNPNDTSASPTYATATVTAAGTNTLDGAFVSDGLGNAVTIITAQGSVKLSNNAHTAAAGSITFTDVSSSTTGAGPETAETWMAAGTNIDASGNLLFYVGTNTGTNSGSGAYNTGYFGILAPGAGLGTISWSSYAGQFSGQVLGQPGVENQMLLYGVNSPGNTSTAAISAFRVHPVYRSNVAATCKGATYLSTDYGRTFFPSDSWGNPDVNCITSDPADDSLIYVNTQDFPAQHTITGKGLSAQLQMTVNVASLVMSACAVSWVDGSVYNTGYYLTNTSGSAGHLVPSRSDAAGDVAVWKSTKAAMQTTTTSMTFPGDFETTSGVTFNNETFNVAGAFGTVTETGSLARTRDIRPGISHALAGTDPTGTYDFLWLGGMSGGRLWHLNGQTGTWTQTTASDAGANPFTVSGNVTKGHGSLQWDPTRKVGYVFDRAGGIVWRVSAADPTHAVPMFADSWSYSLAPEVYGNLSVDVANDILWVTTKNGVWFIPNASTVTARRDKTAATAAGFLTYFGPTSETPGQIFWSSAYQRLYVNTIHFTSGTTTLYPVGGAYPSRGPRWLTITNPTVSTQWEPVAGKADDTTQDPNYNVEMVYPHGGYQTPSGTKLMLTQQGQGLLYIQPTNPVAATLTATARTGTSTPAVAVELAGFTTDGPVTVYRQHVGWNDATPYPVRGITAISGGAAFGYDYEAPFGVAITYYAMNGATRIESAPMTLDITSPWLSVPGLPAYGAVLEVLGRPQINRNRPLGTSSAFGASEWAVRSDTRKKPTFTVQVRARTSAEADNIDQVLDHAGVALLRIPGSRLPWQYVAIGQSPWAPATAYGSTGTAPKVGAWETCSLDCLTTGMPVGGVYGDPTSSYLTNLHTYPTYQERLTAQPTYLDGLRGV